MYAESLGSFALIPSLIFEYREDEGPLKLPHSFRASHASPIHLQDDTLEFFLHGDFIQTELNACEVDRHHHGKNLGRTIERGRLRHGKGRDIGYALAVRSLRGSQQRGSMHHHGP